jgi:hypothetical protein
MICSGLRAGTADSCPQGGNAIFYINGVDDDYTKAYRGARALKEHLDTYLIGRADDVQCRSVALAPNETYGITKDTLEALKQLASLGDSVAAYWYYEELAVATSANIPVIYILSTLQQIIDTFELINQVDNELSATMSEHLSLYQPEIAKGNKIILAGHSQGNLFANQEAPKIIANGGQLAVVAVATPASDVAGNKSPYTSLKEDAITQAFSTVNPTRLPPETTNETPTWSCVKFSTALCHSFIESYMRTGSASESEILQNVVAAFRTHIFTDDFNRPDGPAGNGWSTAAGDAGGDLVIRSNALSAPGPDGRAGIYRPIQFTGPVTASATVTQGNGFGGLLNHYDFGFLFGSRDTLLSGYGVTFYRADENYSDSHVSLVLNGTEVASQASSFQYGSSLAVSITYDPAGSVTGTVSGGGSSFRFSFPAQKVALFGSNFAIYEGFSDGRSTTITNQTIDNLTIAY